MARPSPLSRPGPNLQGRLGTPIQSGGVAYGGHEGSTVELALTGRPPTHVSASTDPTVTDDDGDGHVVGCRWINLAGAEEFVAVDVSTGAAVWVSTTAGGSSLDVTDGTTTVSPASSIDFDPTFFDVTAPGGGVAEVTFVGASGSTVDIEDEGAAEGAADTIDFVGAGVSVGFAGGTATVTIPGAAGGGDLVHIATTLLGATASDITFTGIPNTYRHLHVRGKVRAANGGNEWAQIRMRVGDGSIDTGNNYATMRQEWGTGSSSSGAVSGNAHAEVSPAASASTTADAFGTFVLDIQFYTDTSDFKYWSGRGYAAMSSEHYMWLVGGAYRVAAAEIDQLRFYSSTGDLQIGTSISVYGVT